MGSEGGGIKRTIPKTNVGYRIVMENMIQSKDRDGLSEEVTFKPRPEWSSDAERGRFQAERTTYIEAWGGGRPKCDLWGG